MQEISPSLSVIIITKNEAHNIRRCLESVKWAQEIIVLDSGSTDETVRICLEYTDRVYETDWPGFGPQKNRALSKASCEWILSIDADEWVSPELRNEILGGIKNHYIAGYWMPRRWIVCGKEIKHGDWGTDWVPRLFRRTQGSFTQALVHEGLIINGKTQKFKKPLYHQSITQIAQGIEKMNLYTTMSAKMKREKGKQSSLLNAVLRGTWMFTRSYIFRLGFLDGKMGFFTAFINAEHSFYKYAKLWDLPLGQQNLSEYNESRSKDKRHVLLP